MALGMNKQVLRVKLLNGKDVAAARRGGIEIEYADGKLFRLPGELLRVNSLAAGESQVRLIAGRRGVAVSDVQVVGNYALKFVFSDKHDTGIYPFNYLYEMGENKLEVAKNYIRRVRLSNVSRESTLLSRINNSKTKDNNSNGNTSPCPTPS